MGTRMSDHSGHVLSARSLRRLRRHRRPRGPFWRGFAPRRRPLQLVTSLHVAGVAATAGRPCVLSAAPSAPSSACSCGATVDGACAPALAAPPPPARPARATTLPTATAGPTSPSGTASARSPSSTATRSYLQSRNGKPLRRYFPELVVPGRAATCSTARSCCSTPTAGRTSTRSASASTRRSRGSSVLAEETPTRFVAFDLLALRRRVLLEQPLRRAPRARSRRSSPRRSS